MRKRIRTNREVSLIAQIYDLSENVVSCLYEYADYDIKETKAYAKVYVQLEKSFPNFKSWELLQALKQYGPILAFCKEDLAIKNFVVCNS